MKTIFDANERAKDMCTLLEENGNDVYGWTVEKVGEIWNGVVIMNNNKSTIPYKALKNIVHVISKNNKLIIYV